MALCVLLVYKREQFNKLFGLSKERPILGDNPKAHKFAWWKALYFSLKSIGFSWRFAFHWKALRFSWKAQLFMKSTAFRKTMHLQGIVTLCLFTYLFTYSETRHLRPSLLPQKSGLTWQLFSEQRDACKNYLSIKPKVSLLTCIVLFSVHFEMFAMYGNLF